MLGALFGSRKMFARLGMDIDHHAVRIALRHACQHSIANLQQAIDP